jgi:hypothetical protein
MTRKRGLLDVRTASRLLEREPMTVYRQLWTGKLPRLKRRGRWFIPFSALRRRLMKRGK